MLVAQPPLLRSSELKMAHSPRTAACSSRSRRSVDPMQHRASSPSSLALSHPSRFHATSDPTHAYRPRSHHFPHQPHPPVPPAFQATTPKPGLAAPPLAVSSSSFSSGAAALVLAASRQDDNASLSLSDEDMLVCDEADQDDDRWSDAGLSSIEGAVSNAERRSRTGSATNSPPGTGNSKRNVNGRSRRLLSLEQSKVLYKILDKTHFPSTQSREAAASQLGVSPRKVQVWFQNRRQVGKKRMMEAVQSLLSAYPCSPSTPLLSFDIVQDLLRSTGKMRFSSNEDERTRAWRQHTMRLALNPSAQEEAESKAAIRELERTSGGSAREIGCRGPHEQRYYSAQRHEREQQVYRQRSATHSHGSGGYARGRERDGATDSVAAISAQAARNSYECELTENDRRRGLARIRASRSAAALRINVPHLAPHPATNQLLLDAHTPATATISTPTYTGPGSATHLETLSARSSHATSFLPPCTLMPPLTPVRSGVIAPAIVTSQKESFSLPALHQHHHALYPPPFLQQEYSHRHYSATATAQPQLAAQPHARRATPPEHQLRTSAQVGEMSLVRRDRRDRSATFTSARSLASWPDNGAGIKQVRTTLTAEWHAQQRMLHHELKKHTTSRSTSPPHNADTQTQSAAPGASGMRYRSSTDAVSRLPVLVSSRRAHQRYAPYDVRTTNMQSQTLPPMRTGDARRDDMQAQSGTQKSGTSLSICAHPASMSPQSSDSVSDDHVSRHAEQPSESTGCSALRACSRRTANTASPIRTAAVHVCASSSPCLGPDASQPTRRRSIAYAPASHVSRTNLQDSSTELRPEQTHSRCHRMDVRSLTNIDINIDMVGAGAKAKAETETKTKTKTELE